MGRSVYLWTSEAARNDLVDPSGISRFRRFRRALVAHSGSEDSILWWLIFLEQSGLVCVVYVRAKTLPSERGV